MLRGDRVHVGAATLASLVAEVGEQMGKTLVAVRLGLHGGGHGYLPASGGR
jgi:hypothetical protein